MAAPHFLLIKGVCYGQNNSNQNILPLLHQLGIQVTCVDHTQLNTTTGEINGYTLSNFDGCIFNAPYSGYAATKKFLMPTVAHPWPVLTINSGANCLDSAPFYSGVIDAGKVAITEKLLVSHAAAGIGDLAVAQAYMMTGDWETGPHGTYTIIAGYNDGAKTWPIIYRHQYGTADNIFNTYTDAWLQIGGIILASVGYYLHLLGLTVPNPIRVHLDMDDVNDTPVAADCITELTAYLQAHNTKATCGINPRTGGTYDIWKISAALAEMKAADDCYDWIIHDHGGGAEGSIWQNDAYNYATIAGKLSVAENGASGAPSGHLGRTAVAAATGLGDRLRIFTPDGYMYFPANTVTAISMKALLSAGAKYFARNTTIFPSSVQRVTYPKGCAGVAAFDNVDNPKTLAGKIITTQGITGTSSLAATTWALIKTGGYTDAQYAMTYQHTLAADKGKWGGVQRAMFHGPCLGVEPPRNFITDIFALTIDPLIAFTYGTVIRWWQPYESM